MIMNSGFGMIGYVLMMILYIVLILGWIILSIICMTKLRDRKLTPTAKAIWALVIAAIPWLGSITFLIVKPTDSE